MCDSGGQSSSSEAVTELGGNPAASSAEWCHFDLLLVEVLHWGGSGTLNGLIAIHPA
jgi:hypothetical protein